MSESSSSGPPTAPRRFSLSQLRSSFGQSGNPSAGKTALTAALPSRRPGPGDKSSIRKDGHATAPQLPLVIPSGSAAYPLPSPASTLGTPASTPSMMPSRPGSSLATNLASSMQAMKVFGAHASDSHVPLTPLEQVQTLEDSGLGSLVGHPGRKIIVKLIKDSEDSIVFRVFIVIAPTSDSPTVVFEVHHPKEGISVGNGGSVLIKLVSNNAELISSKYRSSIAMVNGERIVSLSCFSAPTPASAASTPSTAGPTPTGPPRMGSWLAQYPVSVLVHLLARLVLVFPEENEWRIGQALSSRAPSTYPYKMDLLPRAGTAESRGKRGVMEDFVFVSPVLLSGTSSFFNKIEASGSLVMAAIFDGHGGRGASETMSRTISGVLDARFKSELMSITRGGEMDLVKSRVLAARRGLFATFEELDGAQRLSEDASGTTACVAVLDLYSRVLHVANVGDTRAVLCREGSAFDCSVDHKAMNPSECARIIEQGGFVVRGRALGMLAISRALGDRDLKRTLSNGNKVSPITHEPDVESIALDFVRDEFLVLACDGIFDVMSSTSLIAFVRSCFAQGMTEQEAAQAVLKRAVEVLGSMDNVSCTILRFKWSPAEEVHERVPRGGLLPPLTGVRRTSSTEVTVATPVRTGGPLSPNSGTTPRSRAVGASVVGMTTSVDPLTMRVAQASAMRRSSSKEYNGV